MDAFKNFVDAADSFIWGPVMLILLGGTGIYLTFGLRGMSITKIGFAFRALWKGRTAPDDHKGHITPFNALSTALAATIGTGNIAGVATAIYLGGPGAAFWMWMTALVGLATKYAECVLAVKYREQDELGNYVGGPMYYIKNGLGPKWMWLAWLFAFFGTFAAFGIGNAVQANSVAQAANDHFGVPLWLSGVVMVAFTAVVIIGGITRLGEVSGKLVPFMAIAYTAGSLIIIIANIDQLPAALSLIISDAFTGTAAAGGFAGSTMWLAMRYGVARGVFSNEAGLGTAPIAHAAVRTNDPVMQGCVGMLGTFIDTIIVCSMTALVIVMTGVWNSGQTSASLSTLAFNTGLPWMGFGRIVVVVGLLLFAYTTILGWSYYGERCAQYIFGLWVIKPYRVLWIIVVFVGAYYKEHLELLWNISDALNGLMAIPNLIALLLLSGTVFTITRDYFKKKT